MSASFNNRISKGQILQNELVEFLKSEGISYFITGHEGLARENDAKLKIIKSNSSTSLFVRHYPDITIASSKDSYLIEVKNSTGIEKHCWDNYISLHKNLGLKVLLYLKTKKIYPIQNIKFYEPEKFCRHTGIEIPIIDKVWRAPRLLDRETYLKYIQGNKGYTSGCHFAFIDFNKSIGYEKEVLLKLK